MTAVAIPSGLTYEQLVEDYWHQGHRQPDEAPRPLTPEQDRLEQLLQTELYWDPRWDELYGVHDDHVGVLVPKGLMVGTWQIRHFNDRGDELTRWRNHRIITTAGKTALAAYLASASPSTVPFMKYLSTGTSATAPAAGDTALGGGTGNPITELASGTGSNRITGTASSSTNTYQQQATTAAGRYSGQTLQEAGMHDVAAIQSVAGTPSGVMYDRSLLSPTATMGASDTLQLTFQITIT